jgi:hypothetical protein
LRITECHINRLRPQNFLCFLVRCHADHFWHCWSMIQQVSAKTCFWRSFPVATIPVVLIWAGIYNQKRCIPSGRLPEKMSTF